MNLADQAFMCHLLGKPVGPQCPQPTHTDLFREYDPGSDEKQDDLTLAGCRFAIGIAVAHEDWKAARK